VDFNLFNTVLRLRRARAGMVQQLDQYSFCYEVILDEAREFGIVEGTPRFKVHNRRSSIVPGDCWPRSALLSSSTLPRSPDVPIPGRRALLGGSGDADDPSSTDKLATPHSYDDMFVTRPRGMVDGTESDDDRVMIDDEPRPRQLLHHGRPAPSAGIPLAILDLSSPTVSAAAAATSPADCFLEESGVVAIMSDGDDDFEVREQGGF
jgi:hypothetical protein